MRHPSTVEAHAIDATPSPADKRLLAALGEQLAGGASIADMLQRIAAHIGANRLVWCRPGELPPEGTCLVWVALVIGGRHAGDVIADLPKTADRAKIAGQLALFVPTLAQVLEGMGGADAPGDSPQAGKGTPLQKDV